MRGNNIYTVNPVLARATASSNRSASTQFQGNISNMSVSEKSVLSSVVSNISPNQFAYSNVNANGGIISANTETDVLYITTESPISTEVANDVLLFKIVEDPNHLFVTQAKITEWDNKAGKNHTHKGEDITSGIIAPEVIALLPISHINGLTIKLSDIDTSIGNRYTKPEVDLMISALQSSINQLAADIVNQPNSYSSAYIDETFATKASVTLVSNALNSHITTGMHITQAERTLLSCFSIVDGRIEVSVDFYSLGEISAYGVGSGSGGGSGLITSVLGSAGLGGSYLDSDLTNTFNAYTINLINNNLTSALGRIGTLETNTPNVVWGTATSQYSPLTINSVSRNLSLDGHTHNYLPLSGGNLTGALTINGNTIWHAGNDGAGSGLEADTLDALHGSAYMRYEGWVNNPGYNANTMAGNTSGFTYANNAPFTGPVANIESGGYNLEINAQYNNDSLIAYRVKNADSGTWNTWRSFYNSANANLKTVDWAAKNLAAVNISADGTFLSSGAATLRSTLDVDGLSTLKGISVTNGTYSKAISVGSNGGIQIAGVIDSFTYSLPATIGWYRVAVAPVGIERLIGQFDISWTLSSYYGAVSLTAGMMYASSPFISQSAYTTFGTCITKSRIVYHTSYSGNYAYLEIYNETGKAVSLTVKGYDLVGWTLYSSNTVGGIPTNYSNKELTHTSGYVTSGNIYALGEVTAYSASDIRLKKNINSIVSALPTIDRLNPVTYNWNSTAKELNNMKTDGLEYGLIAQELEGILPELVHPLYSDYKAIDYIKLIPLLIKGIQELNKKIKDHGIN